MSLSSSCYFQKRPSPGFEAIGQTSLEDSLKDLVLLETDLLSHKAVEDDDEKGLVPAFVQFENALLNQLVAEKREFDSTNKLFFSVNKDSLIVTFC